MQPTKPTRPASQARFRAGSELFASWQDDVHSGKGPVLYQHAFRHPEIGPGLVTVIGGAPTAGKTSLTTTMGIEMLRFNPDLRLVVANCEMDPKVLLDRQLSRLSGIDGELVRHRAFAPEHRERLEVGFKTLGAVIERVAFMDDPFDIGNVAATVDAFGADLLIIDYVQRLSIPTQDVESRHRVNRAMDYLRRFANMGLAVIVVSALGRTRDKAGRSSYDGEGMSLASFRETSELEYGADDALILSVVDKKKDPDILRLAHLKARHGRQVDQDLHFDRAVQSFTLLSSAAPGAKFSAGERAATTGSPPVERGSVTEELRRLWDTITAAEEGDDGGGDHDAAAGLLDHDTLDALANGKADSNG